MSAKSATIKTKNKLKTYLRNLSSDRETQIVTGIFLVILIAGYFLFHILTDKPMGTWRYGACKTIIEQIVPYPGSVDILAAGEKSLSSLIYFSKRNAFGDERLHLIDCQYKRDPQSGYVISAVTLDDTPVSPQTIQEISKTLLFMIETGFDYELPQGFSLDLAEAKDRKHYALDPVYK